MDNKCYDDRVNWYLTVNIERGGLAIQNKNNHKKFETN